jgi:NAD(P)-dependent dehydrogenase (short-subunit alcohol dehydrogenase family)
MRTLAELGNLKGQLALITGGAGHVGRTVAAGLAELGCDLCLLDLAESKVDEVAAELQARLGSRVVALHVDLEIETERCRVPAFVKEHFGRLDILINNAAFYPREKLEGWVAPLEEQRLEVIRRCIEVNLTAGFHLTQILVGMLRQNRGRIINIGSIYGVLGPDYSLYGDTGMGNPAAYAMSKGGLIQLSRWMATTLAPVVRVNCLCLGGVTRNQSEFFVERYIARTPLARMATEEDFKGAVAFLGSDLSAYVTGQVLMVDGGWTAW